MWLCNKGTERGFTLIEVILTLFFLSLIVTFVPLIVSMNPELQSINSVKEKEVLLFFNQLAMEIREAEQVTIDGKTLQLLKPNGQMITIEQYNEHLRRRVNMKGHDLFLQNIADVAYEYARNGVFVTITNAQGVEYRRRFETIIDERRAMNDV